MGYILHRVSDTDCTLEMDVSTNSLEGESRIRLSLISPEGDEIQMLLTKDQVMAFVQDLSNAAGTLR